MKIKLWMMKNLYSKIILVGIFAIAMGFMESAVVVYLRAIYYPDGFTFPLQNIDGYIGLTEILREAATMIMLLGIGFLAARKGIERFAWFIFAFAVWDIFYYVFLKLILNWPESLLTWDILFLIPFTWVGPVLAPIINSLTMTILALVILHFTGRKNNCKVGAIEWSLLIAGSLMIMINYMEDYTAFMMQRFSFIELFASSKLKEIMELSSRYIPMNFNWYWFIAGELLFFAAIFLIIRKNSTTK
ncbi:MAG: hypothetical protein U5Q03_19280 [Bacteroidota bacterium]|nr:hypothetical protein [Bacteroidota bacterium]